MEFYRVDLDRLYVNSFFTEDCKFLVSIVPQLLTSFKTLGKVVVTRLNDFSEVVRFELSAEQFAISPDGNLLAATSLKCVQIWDLRLGTHLLELTPAAGEANRISYGGVSFSPDGSSLAVCYQTHFENEMISVCVLDSSTGKTKFELLHKDNDTQVDFCTFFEDGSGFAAFSYDYDFTDHLYIWDTTNWSISEFCDEYSLRLYLSRSGRYLVSVHEDKYNLWESIQSKDNQVEWQLISKCADYSFDNEPMQFSPDETLLVSLETKWEGEKWEKFAGSYLRLWDIQNCKEQQRIEVEGKIYCFAFSPDNKYLAFIIGVPSSYWDAAPEYSIVFFEIATQKKITEVLPIKREKPNHKPIKLSFSKDRKWLAIDFHNFVQIFRVESFVHFG